MQPMFHRQEALEVPAVSVSEASALRSCRPVVLPPAVAAAVWRGDALGQTVSTTWPSGFDALDAVLPGGGWPGFGLTELLLPQAGTLSSVCSGRCWDASRPKVAGWFWLARPSHRTRPACSHMAWAPMR